MVWAILPRIAFSADLSAVETRPRAINQLLEAAQSAQQEGFARAMRSHYVDCRGALLAIQLRIVSSCDISRSEMTCPDEVHAI